MVKLNYEKLNDRLTMNTLNLRIVEYIYEVNGDDYRRIDYRIAAKALGVAWHTLSAHVDELIKRNIIKASDIGLKVSSDIIINEQ